MESVVRRSGAGEADLEEMSAPSLHLQWSPLSTPALSEPSAWPAASCTLHIAQGFCHRTNTRAGWPTETSSLRPTWFPGLLYQRLRLGVTGTMHTVPAPGSKPPGYFPIPWDIYLPCPLFLSFSLRLVLQSLPLHS